MNHFLYSLSCLSFVAGLDQSPAVGLSGAQQRVPMSTGCCCPCPANNQRGKCEEMDQSSSLADEKGRNLANCNAFINAKLYRDAESKPSQQ